jgi:hypothetical protein
MKGIHMDIKREENESIAGSTDITSFLSPVYIKYYFISLIFMFVIMVYSFFSSNPEIPEIGFWKGLLILIIIPPVTALGAFIGRLFRDYTRPDFILTSGAGDTFKTKLFWSFGPQLIGWFLTLLVMDNLFR